jgi:homoserine acetyltransferase
MKYVQLAMMSSICNVTTCSDPPNDGLAVARQIAMISYRTPHGYESKFSRRKDAASGAWEVRTYLEYQVS